MSFNQVKDHILTISILVSATVSFIGIVAVLIVEFDLTSKEFFASGFSIVVTIMAGVFSAWISVNVKNLITRRKRVFFSYSHSAKPTVTEFARAFKKSGVRVWMDSERIHPGQSIPKAINLALEDADAVVAFIGKELSSSAKSEIEAARRKGIPIIPVVIENGQLPKELEGLRYFDLRGGSDQKAIEASLLQAI